MKNKLLLTFCFLLISSLVFSQNKLCEYNIKLKLRGDSIILLDSIRDYTIQLDIENWSDEKLNVNTDDIPNYEDNDYTRINFVFLYDSSKTVGHYYKPIYLGPADVQDVRDPLEDTRYTLTREQSYTYRFDLFRFYVLRKKGNYKISAFYRIPLENGGYYLKYSDNYVSLQVR